MSNMTLNEEAGTSSSSAEEAQPAQPAQPTNTESLMELSIEYENAMDIVWRGRLEWVSKSNLPVDEWSCSICGLEYACYSANLRAPSSYGLSQGKCLPRRVECGHIFGDQCINRWAFDNICNRRDVTCPMCRTVLINPAERPGVG